MSTFYEVWAFEHGFDDFRVQGIYSSRAEADAHYDRLKSENAVAPGIVEQTLESLFDTIISQRLAPLLARDRKVTITIETRTGSADTTIGVFSEEPR